LVRLEDQIQQLQGNIGTAREWTSIVIDDEDGEAEVVALCHETHAPLISAAPDLLAALESTLSGFKELAEMGECGLRDPSVQAYVTFAESAIAKAKGSTP
jgi:hypothetical protein